MGAADRAVLVAGGSGFIGSALCRRLLDSGRDVTVLTRSHHPDKTTASGAHLRHLLWNPDNPPSSAAQLADVIGDFNAIVNLAGESIVSGRWTERVKRRILDSRLLATRTLVRAMELAQRKPGVLINASAIGYYGTEAGSTVSEMNQAGNDFLASVCGQWEQEALQAAKMGVRVIRLRIGVVLGRDGGALAKMIVPFKIGLGGPLGSGTQWMSWIHVDDLTSMILWVLEQPKIAGPVNAVAPHPATNLDFSKKLAQVLHRPCVVPAPAFAVRLILGEACTLLLDGQDVMPQAALDGGFQFQYPDLEPALRQLVSA